MKWTTIVGCVLIAGGLGFSGARILQAQGRSGREAIDLAKTNVFRVDVASLLSQGGDHSFAFNAPVGTAFVVRKDIAVSSLHAMAGANQVSLIDYLGRDHNARVVRKCEDLDLVLLAVETPGSGIPLKESLDEAVGDKVFAVGFNAEILDQPVVTKGIVSAFGRPRVSVLLSSLPTIISDARSNSGFSGGALINEDGAVIGMIAGRLFPTPTESAIGLYAIPSAYIERILRLNDRGLEERAFDISDKLQISAIAARRIHGRKVQMGAEVKVPAERSQFQSGDVIVSVDGLSFSSLEELRFLWRTTIPGNGKVTVLRGVDRRVETVSLKQSPREHS